MPATTEYTARTRSQWRSTKMYRKNLGYLAGAYEDSKNRLEIKFGGLRKRFALCKWATGGFHSNTVW